VVVELEYVDGLAGESVPLARRLAALTASCPRRVLLWPTMIKS